MNKTIIYILVVFLVVIATYLIIGASIANEEYEMHFSSMKKLDSLAGEIPLSKRQWLDSVLLYQAQIDSLHLELSECLAK